MNASKTLATDKGGSTQMKKSSKNQIRERLKALADEMQEIGLAMEYYGGFAYWATHAMELIGAAHITRDWVREMDSDPVDSDPIRVHLREQGELRSKRECPGVSVAKKGANND